MAALRGCLRGPVSAGNAKRRPCTTGTARSFRRWVLRTPAPTAVAAAVATATWLLQLHRHQLVAVVLGQPAARCLSAMQQAAGPVHPAHLQGGSRSRLVGRLGLALLSMAAAAAAAGHRGQHHTSCRRQPLQPVQARGGQLGHCPSQPTQAAARQVWRGSSSGGRLAWLPVPSKRAAAAGAHLQSLQQLRLRRLLRPAAIQAA
jgi:hypothetical protein